MGGNKEHNAEDYCYGEENTRVFSFLVNEPQEPYYGIDHCGRQDNECRKTELEHRVGTQISGCVDISYVENLRSNYHHEAYYCHSADEDINDVPCGKELLDGVREVFILTDYGCGA